MADTSSGGDLRTLGRLHQCVRRFRRLVIAILAVSAISSAAPVADAKTAIDQERVRRALEFVNRFMEGPCLNNEKCQSWLHEYKLGSDDVARALRQIDQALGDASQLQAEIARLEADVRNLEGVRHQAELGAKAMQQQLASLRRDAVDKALLILGDQHFGMKARSPVDLLSQELRDSTARFQCGDQQVILTLFGYFIYDHEIDLTQGEKTFRLAFQPVPFARGGSLGQAVDEYTKKAQLSLEPRLQVAAESISVPPASQRPKPLDAIRPAEWPWILRQPWWSAVTETDGGVSIRLASPEDAQDLPSLRVKVKGRPWWWPLTWIWDKVLSNVQAWAVGLVVAGIAWRQGLVAALRWLWEWIKQRAAGGKAGG